MCVCCTVVYVNSLLLSQDKDTPLCIAVRSRRSDIVDLLVSYGADTAIVGRVCIYIVYLLLVYVYTYMFLYVYVIEYVTACAAGWNTNN